MSFIDKDSNIVINAKLTTEGRKLLASGNLTFNKWQVGDSEIDYTYAEDTGFNPSDSIILTPKDKYPNLKYTVRPTSVSATGFKNIDTIVPVETRVRNTAKERGFFTGDTVNGYTANTSNEYVIQDKLQIFLSGVTGTNTVDIKQDTGFSFKNNLVVGDYLMVQWINPDFTGTTIENGSVSLNDVVPYNIYKIQSFTGTITGDTLNVVLDRNLPNFNGQGGSISAKCIIYPGGDAIYNFYGSGDTIPYWNDNTLAFNSNCNIASDEVLVWNMNIVYSEDIAGKQTGYETYAGFGSSGYTGFKNYVSQTFDNPSKKCIGIIHYSNNSISNFYGEQFYQNTPVLELPTIISCNSTGNTVGLTLHCDSTLKTSIIGTGANNLSTSYYDLIDDSGFVYGKCFINLKLFVIEDEELIAALSYKSNRNYTLPKLTDGGFTAPIAVTRPNIFTDVNQKLYVTYLFESSTGYTSNLSYGYGTGLHNQSYFEITPNLVNGNLSPNNVAQFMLDSGKLKFLSENFNDGNGLTFDKFKILVQRVNNQTDRPNPASWLEYDYTSKLTGYPWGGGNIPASAFTSTIYALDNNLILSGSTYNLNNYIDIPLTAEQDILQFGDEVFFLGNVKTQIEATVFKTKFVMNLPFNEYNTSLNPTWSDTTQPVYISEVGVYSTQNSQDVLVAIGKLSTPIQKKNTQVRVIELSIDF